MSVVAKSETEVYLRRCVRHLENFYDVITPTQIDRFIQVWYTDAEQHADNDEGIKMDP